MGEKHPKKGKKRPMETKPAKKKDSPKRSKKKPKEKEEAAEEEIVQVKKKATPQIDWSDDEDSEEEEPKEEGDDSEDLDDEEGEKKGPKTAKKIPVSEGVKKKLQDLMRVINGLQAQLAQKGREAQEVRNSIMLLSADYQELNREHEFIKLEMAKKDALLDKHNRRIARFNEDFEKVRLRQQADKEETIKKSGARILKRVLDILHDFDMAIKEAEGKQESKPVVEGFNIVRKQFEELLISEKVEEIKALNEAFDPRFHEAVEMVENKDVPSDTVVEVIQKGYMLHDNVLRPTKVRVSRGGPERERPKKEEKAQDDKRVHLSDMPELGEKVEDGEQAAAGEVAKEKEKPKREKPAPPPEDEPGFDWAGDDEESEESPPPEEEEAPKKKPKRPADEADVEKQTKLKEAFEELDEFLESEEGQKVEDKPIKDKKKKKKP